VNGSVTALVEARALKEAASSGKLYAEMKLRVKPGAIKELGTESVVVAKKYALNQENGEKDNFEPGKWITIDRYETKEEFRGISIVIWDYSPAGEPPDAHEYIPASFRRREDMIEEARQWIGRVEDGGLRELLSGILLGGTEGENSFFRAAAAVKYHHACRGGLAEHTLEVVEIAFAAGQALAKSGVAVDFDVLIAGALLHDAGKTQEYEFFNDLAVSVRQDAALVGHHPVSGVNMLRWAVSQEGRQYDCELMERCKQVAHIIYSHHGRPEWGAVVAPATVEAVIVHYADMLSSKGSMLYEAVRNAEITQRRAGYRLYDSWIAVLPPDAAEAESEEEGARDTLESGS